MCGRASLTKNQKELEERFDAKFYSEDIERYNPIPNYNIAPMQYLPVITNKDLSHFNIFRWGLIPYWAKDVKIANKLINARAETLLTKIAFKGSLKSRRCIIPLDGFYEWQKQGSLKKPFRIIRTDKDIFSVAGLWDIWTTGENQIIETFTIITVQANNLVKKIHNRMPAILFEDEEKLWIDQGIKTDEALELLKPYPSELMYAYPVSSKINNTRNSNPKLIKEVPEINIHQGKLFK